MPGLAKSRTRTNEAIREVAAKTLTLGLAALLIAHCSGQSANPLKISMVTRRLADPDGNVVEYKDAAKVVLPARTRALVAAGLARFVENAVLVVDEESGQLYQSWGTAIAHNVNVQDQLQPGKTYFISSWYKTVADKGDTLPWYSSLQQLHKAEYGAQVIAYHDPKIGQPDAFINVVAWIGAASSFPWLTIVLFVAAVLLLNLALFIAATRIRWLRTVLLSPVGSHVVGLVFGKYVLTDWLIRFVLPLKLAMFRDYRRELKKSPNLKKWDSSYVPPEIEVSLQTTEAPCADRAAADAVPAWKAAFRTLLAQPRRRVWLLVGQSGLGKTALLENWTRFALELGQTPFLIRLRSGASERAAAQMAHFGDIEVQDKVAFNLLTGGGFVVLLDGLNEAPSRDDALKFVRQVVNRNLVVVTSQFDPKWEQENLWVARIELRPFGREQLLALLDPSQVDKLLGEPRLADIAGLPVTARLLASYVAKNKRLPFDRLEVYDSLREPPPSDPDPRELPEDFLLNVEEQAWGLFKDNKYDFSPDSGLPAHYCMMAIDRGLLTVAGRVPGRESTSTETLYRFPHPTIQAYLVASYIENQPLQPLAEWHAELKPTLARKHWADVLDFRGEMLGRKAIKTGNVAAYVEFLRDAAKFSPQIFSGLYTHYRRLRQLGSIPDNHHFDAWAADLLADVLSHDPEWIPPSDWYPTTQSI